MTNKSECKIRLLDEVNAVVVGLHGDHIDILYNKYAAHAPGYFFNPRFKMGMWDGKIHYFSDKGRTYVHLLDDILPRVAKWGYKLVIEDLRTSNKLNPEPVVPEMYEHVLHKETGEPTIMRDYQYENVNRLLEHGYGIIKACTGAGKTIMCTALVDSYGKLGVKTLTIVPSQDLIRNTKADYSFYGLDVGEYSGEDKDIDHQHVVSTWQALAKNVQLVKQFQLVLVDECHGAKGPVLQKILTDNSANILYRFGVTGTIPKDESDAMQVHIALGPIRGEVEAVDLMARGILAQLNIDVIILEEDLKDQYAEEEAERKRVGMPGQTYIQFKDKYFPDYVAEKSYIHRNTERLEWIADLILAKQDNAKGNVLCFVDSIPLGRQLAAMIPGAMFVNGQDVKKSKKREEIYNLFRVRDDLVVFATVHIAGTGLNIPRINHLVTVDIGKSFIRIIQAIGRALRIAKDKTHVTHTDICSDLKYGKKHLKERTNYYDEAKYIYKKFKIDYMKMLVAT